MAGDQVSFEHGAAKAMQAPLQTAMYALVVLVFVLVGRGVIDGYRASKLGPDILQEMRTTLLGDIALAEGLPTILDGNGERAMAWALAVYELIYVSTHADRYVNEAPENLSEAERSFQRGLNIERHVLAAIMLGTQIVIVRILALLCALPFLAVMYLIGLADGWAARYVRRACVGRESSTIYHRGKYLQVTALSVVALTIVWWPTSPEFRLMVVASVLCCTILLRIQVKYFKKYL